jgi:hypothetical protein
MIYFEETTVSINANLYYNIWKERQRRKGRTGVRDEDSEMFSFFIPVHPGKCRDSILTYVTAALIHIPSK